MGATLKVFFVADGEVTPVARRDFERLRAGDPGLSFAQFAGQRVRCALAVVEFQSHRPVAVARVDYVVLPFGADGRLEQREVERTKWLAVNEVSGTFGAVSEPDTVSGYVVSGRYRDDFVWVPTEAEADAVAGLALRTSA